MRLSDLYHVPIGTIITGRVKECGRCGERYIGGDACPCKQSKPEVRVYPGGFRVIDGDMAYDQRFEGNGE